MAIFIIRPRAVGADIAVEGVRLELNHKEGSGVAVIAVLDSGDQYVAIVPSDAVEAVYKKEAEKAIE